MCQKIGNLFRTVLLQITPDSRRKEFERNESTAS